MVATLNYVDGDINVQSENDVTWEGGEYALYTKNNQWVIADQSGNDLAFSSIFSQGTASAHDNNPIDATFGGSGTDSYNIVAQGDSCDSSSSDSNDSNSSAGAQGDPHISPLFGKKYTI